MISMFFLQSEGQIKGSQAVNKVVLSISVCQILLLLLLPIAVSNSIKNNFTWFSSMFLINILWEACFDKSIK